MKKITYRKRKLINYVKIKCRELPVIIRNSRIKQLILNDISQEMAK
jgi:hypothetical protein